MKKIIYLILFLPVIGFGQVNPWQIEPDTTHRMIMMTDTSVIDSPALEFVYSSIDSLVRQITKDSLGLDSTYWSLDDSLSLSPINQTNNIVLGNLSGNTSMTGSYNFLAGGQLGQNLTTGSYNTIFGNNNANNISTSSYTFVSGVNNGSNSPNMQGTFFNGANNGATTTGNLQYSFFNGVENLRFGLGVTSYMFANGYRNANNANVSNYSFYSGHSNFYSGTGDLSYNFGVGFQNAYNSAGSFNQYNFLFGNQNLYNANDIDFNFAVGSRNLYNSTSNLQNTISIGRENGYSATADHSNSIYLGYRNAYNGSGVYNNYQGYEAGYFQTGSYNVGLGYRALYGQSGLSAGNDNIALGNSSLRDNTNSENIAIGLRALEQNSGFRNISFGTSSGRLNTADYNFFMGVSAGHNNSGNYNNFFGYNSGYDNTTIGNNAFGFEALKSSSLGSGYNNAFGYRSINLSTTPSYNQAIGRETLRYANTGNVAIGHQSGYTTTGDYNVFLGYRSGYLNTGSSNVFIGDQAGYNETGSNKLYIENSNSTTPLIYGDFANDTVRINGNLEVTNKTGTAGNLAGFDGDQIVDSGIDASSVLTSETDEFGAMDFYNVGSTYFFRAEDDLGNGLGDAMSLTPGTNISFVNTGNNLTISATGSTQTLSKSGGEVSLSGGGGSVEVHTILSGGDVVIVDDLNATADVVMGDIDITSRGTTATSVIGRDANGWVTSVGTGAGITLSGGNLVNTEISKWDDLGTYIEPSNNEAVRISDGLQDAGGSSGGSGDILISTGSSDVDWWDKGIARGYEGTDNTTSASYVTWPPNSNYDSPVDDGSLTISGKTITASEAGWYRITVSGENQSTGQCNGAIYTTSAVYSQTIGTGHDNGASYTPASFSMHWIGSYASSTSFTFRVYATSGSCILDNVVFSVEQIKKN